MRKILLLAFAFVWAQVSLFAQNEASWLRYPAISPDGSTIVFTYRGDLFTIPAQGGKATPLTFHEAHDYAPVWSPDGRHIAFASDRFGNFDVFIISAQGGEARRLTFHSANDVPSGFSPDGKEVLFTSSRTDDVRNAQFPSKALPELYSVPVEGGRNRMVLTTPAEDARWLPSGSGLVYHDKKGGEDPWRKHHVSSVARDLWHWDKATGKHTQLTHFAGEDRNPVPTDQGQTIYYLSEEGGTFNIFSFSLANPAQVQRHTHFKLHPARFLSAASNGTLCFSYNGQLYTMPKGGQPQRIGVQISTEQRSNAERIVSISDGAQEMALSPNGKEIAFVVRGEIFVTAVDGSTTRRITNTPEAERSVSFSPDGRSLVYATERNGSWQIYQTSLVRKEEDYFFNATSLKEEAIIESDKETFQPAFSPDGKELAYIEERTTLKVRNLATKAERVIMTDKETYSHVDGDQDYQWSPDGKWLLVRFLQPGYWIGQVGLVSADGKGKIMNLTQSGYDNSSPRWMMGGKMMIWFSNRDGLRSYATSGTAEADVYGMFFTQESFDRFKLSKEEFALLKEKEDKAKKDDKKEDDKKKEDKSKDNTTQAIKIEPEGLHERKARLSIHSSRLSDAVLSKDGEKLYYLARFEKGYDLWATTLRTRETKILVKLNASSGGQLEMDKEGKNLFMLSGGRLSKIDPESGKQEGISFSSEMNLHTLAEREYLFSHVWHQVRKKFYKADLHNAPWDTLRTEYSRYLPHIGNNYEFAEMLGELLGELNASHTGARYSHSMPNADATASPGAFYDLTHTGNGLKIAEIMEKSPLLSASSKIKAGHIIEKIDGELISPQTDEARLLNRKAGKNTLLSLYNPADNTRWEETVKPVSQSEEAEMLYKRWVENNRKRVEELSGGTLGYVHVRGMNDGSYRTVYEEVLGKHATNKGLVVDTRFNGGGDLVSDLSNFLSGVQFMVYRTEDRPIGMEPSARWTKPSVVLAGESNYSDAHCFPFAYKELGIGKLVGMPVPGTCTFVWWERTQDPSLVFGIPNLGATDMNGTYLENTQLNPDILVANEYGTVATGTDQQLERAVAELMKEVEKK